MPVGSFGPIITVALTTLIVISCYFVKYNGHTLCISLLEIENCCILVLMCYQSGTPVCEVKMVEVVRDLDLLWLVFYGIIYIRA